MASTIEDWPALPPPPASYVAPGSTKQGVTTTTTGAAAAAAANVAIAKKGGDGGGGSGGGGGGARLRIIKPPPLAPNKARVIPSLSPKEVIKPAHLGFGSVIHVTDIKKKSNILAVPPSTTGQAAAGAPVIIRPKPPKATTTSSSSAHNDDDDDDSDDDDDDAPPPPPNVDDDAKRPPGSGVQRELALKAAQLAKARRSRFGHVRQISIPPPPPPAIMAEVLRPPTAAAAAQSSHKTAQSMHRRRLTASSELESDNMSRSSSQSSLPPPPPPSASMTFAEPLPPPPPPPPPSPPPPSNDDNDDDEEEEELPLPPPIQSTPADQVKVRQRFSHMRTVSGLSDTSTASSASFIIPPPPTHTLADEKAKIPPLIIEEDVAIGDGDGSDGGGDDDDAAKVAEATAALGASKECGHCHQVIQFGNVIDAAGQYWHPQHFFCHGRCHKPLVHCDFYVHEGDVYCEEDYTREFSTRCAGCGRPVLNGVGTDDVVYHVACLACSVCGAQSTQDLLTATADIPYYFNVRGEIFCEQHYKQASVKVSVCAHGECGKPIDGECALILGKEYHPACVRCHSCQLLLGGNEQTSHVYVGDGDGRFYCLAHLPQKAIAECSCCRQSIMAAHGAVKINGAVMHRECAVCRECRAPLYAGTSVFLDEPTAAERAADPQAPYYVLCHDHAHRSRQAIASLKAFADSSNTTTAAAVAGSNMTGAGAGARAAMATDVVCSGCSEALTGNQVVLAVGGKKYHEKCLVCDVCRQCFPGGRGIYRLGDQRFLCKSHYIEQTANQCGECQQYIISGKMITSSTGAFYHETCFYQVTQALVQPSTDSATATATVTPSVADNA